MLGKSPVDAQGGRLVIFAAGEVVTHAISARVGPGVAAR